MLTTRSSAWATFDAICLVPINKGRRLPGNDRKWHGSCYTTNWGVDLPYPWIQRPTYRIHLCHHRLKPLSICHLISNGIELKIKTNLTTCRAVVRFESRSDSDSLYTVYNTSNNISDDGDIDWEVKWEYASSRLQRRLDADPPASRSECQNTV